MLNNGIKSILVLNLSQFTYISVTVEEKLEAQAKKRKLASDAEEEEEQKTAKAPKTEPVTVAMETKSAV